MKSTETISPAELARAIDHTLLRADATFDEIEQLCREALEHNFLTVCVNAVHVERCCNLLIDSGTSICSVIGFPLASCGSPTKVFETKYAIDRGASEIDMVINLGALKSGQDDLVRAEVQAVAEVCHANAAQLKVILETCLLTDDQKRHAAQLAIEGGADYLKTSTGFSSGGATVEDVRLLRQAASEETGIKAAGGIGSAEFALELLRAGATRLGCSKSVQLLGQLAD